MSFENLGLNPLILKAVAESGYTQPTPVQEQAIPAVLAGEDLMVSSNTGSGKTAAFMLPALQKLGEASTVRSLGPRILVLSPTRELALQITKASETYGRFLKRVNVVSVLGGMPYHIQLKQLKQPVEIMVATPGRLLDHMQSGRLDFSRLEVLILDEADRMLDMGFIDDIEMIVKATPKTRQTLMFSATFDGPVGKLAERLMRTPRKIEIMSHTAKHENIEQRLHYADNLQHKGQLLDELLRDTTLDQAIVFTATKRDADRLAEDLTDQGFAASALHGDMKQGQRNRTLTNLRRGNIRILVATDVAARGIDVPTISHVINYDLPKQAEDYIHRIGRTGRAGRQGVAITIANVKEHFDIKRIERFTSQQIPVHVIPGFEPKTQPKGERGTKGSSRGGRPGDGNGKSWGNKSGGKSYGGRSGNSFGNSSGSSFGGKSEGKTFGERSYSKPFGESTSGERFAKKPFNSASTGTGGEFKKTPRTFAKPAEGRTWEPRKPSGDVNGNVAPKRFENKPRHSTYAGNSDSRPARPASKPARTGTRAY